MAGIAPGHHAPLALLATLAMALAPQLAHAQGDAGQRATKKLTTPNAFMSAAFYDRHRKHIDTWSGFVLWNGDIPDRFDGTVTAQGIQWHGRQAENIRVGTSRRGRGGERLRDILPGNTAFVVVTVFARDGERGSSKTPSAHGRKSTSNEKNSKPRRYRPQQTPRRQQPPPRTRRRRHRKTAEAVGATRRARRPKRSADIGDAPSVRDKKSSERPASLGDGPEEDERARDHAVTGTGKRNGTEGGEPDDKGGKAGGKTAEQGGMRAPNASARGQGTAAQGMKGGTGPQGSQGLPAGGGIWPLITIPASLRHLSDTLLILKDANPTQLASRWMKTITKRMTVYRLRKQLKTAASTYARKRLDSLRPTIDQSLKHATQRERERLYRQWFWEIERQYFARVEQGAVAKLAESGLSRTKRRQATKLLEAAKVKPVTGQLPRNHEYAGKWLPRRKLPRGYKTKGLRFTEEGYPDFGPHALELKSGDKTVVRINMTGSYRKDFKLANEASGFPYGPPEGYTWHHVEDGTTMMLVPTDLHAHVRHSGGRAVYRHRTGDLSAYPN